MKEKATPGNFAARLLPVINLTFLAVLFSIIFAAAAGATTYYVSPTGSDSSSGSSSAPFKTIQKAANIVNPGDTVIVEDGTYTDTDGDGFIVNLNRGGTSSSWVTFKAANKWGAKLDGQTNTTGYGWNFGSSAYYVHVEGFEIYGCGNGGFWLNSSGNHDVDLYQNKVHDIARYYISCTSAELTYGNVGVYTGTSAYNITFDSNVFFNIGRLYGGCTTYDQNHDHALYLYGNNLDIINNVFYDNTAGWDIVLAPGSSNIDVVNNTFVFPNPYRDGHLLLWGNQTNIVIENNTFYKPTTAPINTGSAGTLSNMTLKNNLTTTGGMFSGASTGFTVASNMTGTDPLFVDSTNYDFHLQSTSPAIAKGLTTYAPTYDFDGDTRSGAPDLGAYEYAPATSLTTSTDTTAPSTPTGLTATAASSSQINLSWTASTDNVGVSGYKVYRGGTLIATTTTASYSDTGLTASTSYSYAVAAFDAAGNVSSMSSSASATTSSGTTSTTSTVSVTYVYLNDVSVSAGSSAQVTFTTTPSTAKATDLIWSTNSATSTGPGTAGGSASYGTISSSGVYTPPSSPTVGSNVYKIWAVSKSDSTVKDYCWISVTAAADTTAPSTPAGLTATAASTSQINLSWTASTDNVGVTGYKVYRNGTQIATATGTTYSNTGLTASTPYTYTVAAYDAAGNTSAQSASASATTQAAPDTTAPSVPTGLTATVASSSQINLSWTASTDNVGVAGYKIYRGGTLIATTQSTSYSNTGLAASTTYTYTVAAYDSAGNVSAQSASTSATTNRRSRR